MAWTVSKVVEATVGGVRQQVWDLTADSATYELSTGLKNILALSTAINTATSGAIKFKPNILSAGTAALGNVAITGATSADRVYLTVYGN
jgi:hypothetical protein